MKTNENKHTPTIKLPLQVWTLDQSIGTIMDADGEPFAQVQMVVPNRENPRQPLEERHARTEWLVNAANSYPAMLAALQAFMKLDAVHWGGCKAFDDHLPAIERVCDCGLKHAKDLATAALALATGEGNPPR